MAVFTSYLFLLFFPLLLLPPPSYLTASGDHIFKQRRRRFFALIQLDQYQFLLSTFPDNASLPRENLLLDQSYFVEYPNDEGQDNSVNYASNLMTAQ